MGDGSSTAREAVASVPPAEHPSADAARPGGSDLEARWTSARVRRQLFGTGERVSVGRYELDEILGSGAMGVVFSVRDPLLGRHAALKLVRASAEGERRLLREGRALARLSHPNVVRVLDAGIAEGRTFLVLERVEGRTLDAWLAERPRSEDEVISVMLGAGSGLAAAHDQGLVHRDVKPRNILIDEAGTARLGDFGLVRPDAPGAPAEEDGEAAMDRGVAPAPSIDATLASGIVGTLAYMAPEQIERTGSDARADQFAYCATLHEALFGVRPFAGKTKGERLGAITRHELDDARLRGHWLGDLLSRGLEASPDARHASVKSLLQAIEARRDSKRSTEAASIVLDRLERARRDRTADLDELLREATACREAVGRALAAWPENADAVRIDRALAALLVDVAARRRAAHLREHDPELGDRYKAAWTAAVSLTWAAGFGALAWARRAGAFDVGPPALAVFYGAFVLLHVVVGLRIEQRMHQATAAARRMSLVVLVSYSGHALAAVLASVAGATLALTLVAAQLVATVVWATAAVTFDRRLVVVSPFTAIAAIVSAVWPDVALEAAAGAAGLGLGALAMAFRSGEDRPVYPDEGR